MFMSIASLNGLKLPEEKRFRRNINIPDEGLGEDFFQNYDFHTLFYDAFYVARKRAICLICPALLNLGTAVRKGVFSANGRVLKVKSISNYKRYSEVWLRCPEKPDRLQFEYDGFKTGIEIASDEIAAFAGLNCAVIKSKDNDLLWIKDWAEYHVKIHGLQGLVFFDNNSSIYEVDNIVESLRSVKGLKKFCVIPTPYSFGVYSHHETRFLQVGLLNIARLRFLSEASAVLSVDIDELVAPTPEGSVFTSTKRSLLGYLLFRGRWREVGEVEAGQIVRHSDHIYRLKNDLVKSTKYCICPTRIFGLSHWDIHGAVRGFLKDFMVTNRFEYWHLRQISTSWKYSRNVQHNALLPAADTANAFRQAFGTEVARLPINV